MVFELLKEEHHYRAPRAAPLLIQSGSDPEALKRRVWSGNTHWTSTGDGEEITARFGWGFITWTVRPAVDLGEDRR